MGGVYDERTSEIVDRFGILLNPGAFMTVNGALTGRDFNPAGVILGRSWK